MTAMPLLLTILGIGFMIFIHELGHFMAARACGIRVLVFSLGFGPRLFGFRRNGCDYRLSAVPFGGYVLVAGAENFDRHGMTRDEINAKSAGARAFYYSGGVIMNVAFALIVFPLVFAHGVEFTAPVIGRVAPGGLAWQADLRPGDRVLRANGKDIYAFDNLRVEVALAGRQPIHLEIERNGERIEKLVQTTYDASLGLRQIYVAPMIEPTPPELDVRKGTPAWQAGLRDGDRLRGIDGTPVPAAEVEARLDGLEHRPAGTPVVLTVEQADGNVRDVSFVPQLGTTAARIGVRPLQPRVLAVRHDHPAAKVLHVDDEIVAIGGQPFLADSLRPWQDDAGPLSVRVRRGKPATEVDLQLALSQEDRAVLGERVVLAPPAPGDGAPILLGKAPGPAAAAGLRDGDMITAIDGKAIAHWSDLMPVVQAHRAAAMVCDVRRGTELLRVTVQPTRVLDLGFQAEGDYMRQLYKVDGVGNAIHAGLVCSADMLKQLYVTLKEMVTGDVSARNLGGIIQISRVSYAFAESGLALFFYFLAMLSLNLAFVNVLPIPVLDGGHLLFVLIEKIKGSPVSARVHGYSLTLGLVFVIGLMVFVTYNDIARLF
jgi:regulator of sigma E protease